MEQLKQIETQTNIKNKDFKEYKSPRQLLEKIHNEEQQEESFDNTLNNLLSEIDFDKD